MKQRDVVHQVAPSFRLGKVSPFSTSNEAFLIKVSILKDATQITASMVILVALLASAKID